MIIQTILSPFRSLFSSQHRQQRSDFHDAIHFIICVQIEHGFIAEDDTMSVSSLSTRFLFAILLQTKTTLLTVNSINTMSSLIPKRILLRMCKSQIYVIAVMAMSLRMFFIVDTEIIGTSMFVCGLYYISYLGSIWDSWILFSVHVRGGGRHHGSCKL